MPEDLSIEELIIDDSFANYCLQTDEADILFWQEYIKTHPHQKERIEEAMQIVLGLHTMLKQEHEGQNEKQASVVKLVSPSTNKPVIKKILRYTGAVAASLLLVLGIRSYMKQDSSINTSSNGTANSAVADNELVFTTTKGEKKTFLLPDSTLLHLNAGSTVRVEKEFGKKNRTVHLSGEALFDVTHNTALPFIVRSNGYDVKVLGTLFNVKAYPEDKNSETALIRGKVEIYMHNNPGKITLSPNQKVVISTNGKAILNKDDRGDARIVEKPVMMPLSYSEDHVVIETAWSQNRLEIVDESFADIKVKLERWFNVTINFRDEEVSRYRFSATFEKETIEQVLKALQNAYPFNYEMKDNNIAIAK